MNLRSRRSMSGNTIANLCGRIWSMVSVYIFVPFFINILGTEQYGLVSFFATLQATFNLLGLGLSGTLRREFASKEYGKNGIVIKWKLLKDVEILYYFIGVIVILICILSKNFIACKWLNFEHMGIETVEFTIVLMGSSIALQMLCNLWYGCLLGLDFQITANVLYILWALFRNVGALFAIMIKPDIIWFYSVYILFDFAYAILLRTVLLRKLTRHQKIDFVWKLNDLKIMKRILRYTFGLLAISIISLLGNQLGTLIISKLMSLTELGAYNTITTLGSIVRIFATAISITAMTKFTQLYTEDNIEKLRSLYLRIYKIVAVVTMSITAFVAVYASDIMRIWVKNETYISLTNNNAAFQIIGIGLLAMQEIPYCYMLAKGKTKVNIMMGIVTIPIFAAASVVAIKNWGLLGAAVSYLVIYALQTLVYIIIINSEFKRSWVHFILPVVATLLAGVLSAEFLNLFIVHIVNNYIKVLIEGLGGMLFLLLALFLFFRKYIKQRKYMYR